MKILISIIVEDVDVVKAYNKVRELYDNVRATDVMSRNVIKYVEQQVEEALRP